jgi:hypothetical protein
MIALVQNPGALGMPACSKVPFQEKPNRLLVIAEFVTTATVTASCTWGLPIGQASSENKRQRIADRFWLVS